MTDLDRSNPGGPGRAIPAGEKGPVTKRDTLAIRIGVLLTSDNAIDPELWRWCPPGVTLHVTRLLDFVDESIGDIGASLISADPQVVGPATRTLTDIDPAVIAFACTSGSFVRGLSGERELHAAIIDAGAKRAVTTSGALLDAFAALGIKRIAVGTPYDEPCSRRLQEFLEQAGLDVVSLAWAPPPTGQTLQDISPDDLEDLARRSFHSEADALLLSCTALETIDLIEPLMKRYGIPVLTSVQVTMWAALAAAGADMPAFPHPLFLTRPPSLLHAK
jgi:maleate isomerase